MTGDDVGAISSCADNLDVTDGVTRFVAVTLKDDGDAFIYLDGVEAKACVGMQIPNAGGVTPVNVLVGAAATGASFEGTLDEVALFNKVLSPADIKSLYDLGTSP